MSETLTDRSIVVEEEVDGAELVLGRAGRGRARGLPSSDFVWLDAAPARADGPSVGSVPLPSPAVEVDTSVVSPGRVRLAVVPALRSHTVSGETAKSQHASRNQNRRLRSEDAREPSRPVEGGRLGGSEITQGLSG